jgi:hypothetical protein
MIDYFLKDNPAFHNIGKLAIYFEILFHESKSAFNENCFDREDDWMSFLFHKMPNENTTDSMQLEYGEYQNPAKMDITHIFSSIKTLHERTKFDNDYILHFVEDAERIYFLGFGYAKENLNLLNLNSHINNGANIFGSAFKLSQIGIEKAKSIMFPNSMQRSPHSNGFKIPNLLIENSKSLSLLRDHFQL